MDNNFGKNIAHPHTTKCYLKQTEIIIILIGNHDKFQKGMEFKVPSWIKGEIPSTGVSFRPNQPSFFKSPFSKQVGSDFF